VVTRGLFPATQINPDTGMPISIGGTTFDYTTGRFTNGPGAIPAATKYTGVWHEQLARTLALPVATPSMLTDSGGNGNNFAYGGATTANGTHTVSGYTIVDMGQQVRDFLAQSGGVADPDNLYILWGGGNDLIDATRGFFAKPQGVLDAEKQAIANLVVEFKLLADAGATTFLWPNLPPLDKTPYAQGINAGLRTALATASASFASDEHDAIAGLKAFYPNLTIVEMDDYGIINNIIAAPMEYGYVNATGPAQNQNVNPDQYLFWDQLHPTTRAHHDLAGVAAFYLEEAGVTTGCPEPPTILLVALAIPVLLYRLCRLPRRARMDLQARV
jgi:phospholipase/lecithinase/hemolysin